MSNTLYNIKQAIFSIRGEEDFNAVSLAIFRYQAVHNGVYKRFLELIHCSVDEVRHYRDIPFLPIQFFKSLDVVVSGKPIEKVFKSSGTTSTGRSRHLVTDLGLYRSSFSKGWEYFYGDIEDYVVLALLPNYLEQGESSLVYMVDNLIRLSKDDRSGYCLDSLDTTALLLTELSQQIDKKVLLIGVSYALLDLIEHNDFLLGENVVIMETGGMKGRRKELTKAELHRVLKNGFGVENIHSEYGMTELLSQAYSKGDGIFETPPWMKVLVRDVNDPLSFRNNKKSGGINVIDLANLNSCSFIATQDLGKLHEGNKFEILGRFDYSDVRGCNLLVN